MSRPVHILKHLIVKHSASCTHNNEPQRNLTDRRPHHLHASHTSNTLSTACHDATSSLQKHYGQKSTQLGGGSALVRTAPSCVPRAFFHVTSRATLLRCCNPSSGHLGRLQRIGDASRKNAQRPIFFGDTSLTMPG